MQRCRCMANPSYIRHFHVSEFSGSHFSRPQRSCEGYVFTPVYRSVHGGVCLSACWDTSPPHPQGAGNPLGVCTPPPGSRHFPPWQQATPNPPPEQIPQQTATAADGTHPTGMHSCCIMLCWKRAWWVDVFRHGNQIYYVVMFQISRTVRIENNRGGPVTIMWSRDLIGNKNWKLNGNSFFTFCYKNSESFYFTFSAWDFKHGSYNKIKLTIDRSICCGIV